MKQGKLIGIVLCTVNVILLAVYGVIYLGTDRAAPQIGFQSSDVVYRQGMGTEELLKGVTAYDHQDGDITQRVVIEKIIEAPEENTVVVFYAVSDKAGNVAKSSRIFPAAFNKDAESFMEAGVEAELRRINEAVEQEALPLPEGDSEQGQMPEPGQTQTPTPVQTQTPEPASTPEPTPTSAPEQVPQTIISGP